jgi:hypothetical protein
MGTNKRREIRRSDVCECCSDLERLQVCRDFMARFHENLGERDEAIGNMPSFRLDVGIGVAKWQMFGVRHTHAATTRDFS